jgi:hypothetical protein
MTVSNALQRARASAPAYEIILDTIEIRHASFPAPIRLVRGDTDLQATLEASAPENAGEQVTFTHAGFELVLPRAGQDGFQMLTLNIGNIDKAVMRHLEIASANPGPVTVIFRQYLLSDTSGPAIDPPAVLDIESAVADPFVVQAQAKSENWLNQNVHSIMYDLTRFKGLRTA